jgi:aspartyl-tRNA(Asn)/glutamyl-tRNA(Gln) amidotransferase subunit A
MKIFTTKKEIKSARAVVLDDMILTKDMPTSAGSKMLDGYMSLFDAEAVTKLTENGFDIIGKADVGEFSVDLLGETSYNGAIISDGKLCNACAEIVKSGEAYAAVTLDVNGSVRRAAAQNGLISVKPTYGTVSRYGTIPVACSGETVSVMSSCVDNCREVLDAIAGHDNKDGTSLSEELCSKLKKGAQAHEVKKVALLKSMTDGISSEVKEKLDAFCSALKNNGIEVAELDDEVICTARIAWNILMSAELCNNVSRYDGVKYGYRAENFSGIDELYTNSRTEAFGELLKKAILFGSDTLSTDNYMKVYDKALRVRRVICEAFSKIFESYDAVVIPSVSMMVYPETLITENKNIAFEENFYTSPASITGLPAVVVGGVQLIGKAFSENSLLNLAELYEKEGK